MTWYIRVKEAPPPPSEKPDPVIVREESGLVWNGILYSPGTYELPKGKLFDIQLTVENQGGSGKVEAAVYINGEWALRSVAEIESGKKYIFQWLNRTVDKDMSIVLKVRPYGETEWTDEYG